MQEKKTSALMIVERKGMVVGTQPISVTGTTPDEIERKLNIILQSARKRAGKGSEAYFKNLKSS